MAQILQFFRLYVRDDWIKATLLPLIGLLVVNYYRVVSFKDSIIIFISSALLLCFARNINDYFDWKIEHEKNNWSNRPLFLAFIPLFISIILFLLLHPNFYSLSFFFGFIILSVLYSAPKVRLGSTLFSLITNILLAETIFLIPIAFFNVSLNEWLVKYFIFFISLLYLYSELFHQIDDYENDRKRRKTLCVLLGKTNFFNFIFLIFIIFSVGYILFLFFINSFSILKIFPIVGLIFHFYRIFEMYQFRKNNFKKIHRSKMNVKIEFLIYLFLLIFISLLKY